VQTVKTTWTTNRVHLGYGQYEFPLALHSFVLKQKLSDIMNANESRLAPTQSVGYLKTNWRSPRDFMNIGMHQITGINNLPIISSRWQVYATSSSVEIMCRCSRPYATDTKG